jgi:hypothetical protein
VPVCGPAAHPATPSAAGDGPGPDPDPDSGCSSKPPPASILTKYRGFGGAE